MSKCHCNLTFVVLLAYLATPLWAEDRNSRKPVTAPKPPATEYYLGVFTDPIPKALASKFSKLLVENNGLLVTNVLPQSPAAKAGLKPHDILVRYDENELNSPGQLKRLVVQDTLNRSVKLSVVRGNEIRTVEISLAERVVAGTPTAVGVQEVHAPQFVRLMNRGGTPIFVAYDGLMILETKYRWRTPPAPAPVNKQIPATELAQNQAITISITDGTHCRLEFFRFHKGKKSSGHQWEGTPKEIEEQIVKVPIKVATEVRSSLDWAQTQAKRSRATRMQFQPRIEGTKRGMRLLMCLPEKDGSLRCLQVDHFFEDGEPVKIEALLTLEPFILELNRLSSVVREKVEHTLRNTTLPEIQITVERSQ